MRNPAATSLGAIPSVVNGASYALGDPGGALRGLARTGADALGRFNADVQDDPFAAGEDSFGIFATIEGAGLTITGAGDVVVGTAGRGAVEASAADASVVEARTAIQEATNRVAAAHSLDSIARTLTPAQKAAAKAYPNLLRAFVESKFHTLVADELVSQYGKRFVYRTRGIDFLDTWTGEEVELTTPGGIPSHVGRRIPMGSIVTYTLP